MISEQFENTIIELEDVLAYKWQRKGVLFFRGYVYYKEKLCKLDDLFLIFSMVKTKNDVINVLNEFDGSFSLIYRMDSGQIIVCSDRVRSMPIILIINDDAIKIKDGLTDEVISNEKVSERKLSCFRHALYVECDYSIYESIRQVGAGKFALIKDGHIDYVTYFKYEHQGNIEVGLNKVVDNLYESYNRMIKRAINVLDGRKAVIPLSGGHDSRLLLNLFVENGYKNIATYSYGMRNNMESVYSKMVSDYFGVKSHFVEYKRKLLRELFIEHGRDYLKKASCSVEVPCLQEWYAVFTLKQKGIIDKDAVFIPGYSGDFLAGTHLSRDAQTKNTWRFEELIKHIRLRYYKEKDNRYPFMEKEINRLISESVLSYIEKKDYFDSNELNEIVERYDWYNRQSKYIVNAVRSYDFWGYQWLVPYFEKNQFQVWKYIDNKYRYNRRAFFEMEKKYYSQKLQDIPFYKGIPYNRITAIKSFITNGISSVHYMYGYYGINFISGFFEWVNDSLRGVDVYSKDACLDVLINEKYSYR